MNSSAIKVVTYTSSIQFASLSESASHAMAHDGTTRNLNLITELTGLPVKTVLPAHMLSTAIRNIKSDQLLTFTDPFPFQTPYALACSMCLISFSSNGERKRIETDRDMVKKQADQMSKEYDRVSAECQALQVGLFLPFALLFPALRCAFLPRYLLAVLGIVSTCEEWKLGFIPAHKHLAFTFLAASVYADHNANFLGL
ncbi:unnamed protein product [Dibothriocephalus latus]|uniref:Bap31/Bap29 cytoplasmic coiled-coil domain-containing protein n=1 Tax=Dibothriocephalus latus TaxID=60516 RepID=A0A3P7LL08_DIBLA|nr:unnamed protein product [Dibothriocephalus latus]